MKQTGPLSIDAAPAAGGDWSWADRLRAVGTLLDREPGRVRDACVLAVEGGFVVEAVTETAPADGTQTADWIPLSRAFTTDDVAAARASTDDAPRARAGRFWGKRTHARRQR